MMRRLAGKLAVVTASTAGIGYSFAKRLATDGAKVVISSRNPSNVAEAETRLKNEGLEVKGVPCDVQDAAALKSLIQEAVQFGNGGVDILISNAGGSPSFRPLSETPAADIDGALNLNVKSPILLIQEALPHLNDGASIVFNSSVSAYHSHMKGRERMGLYAICKTALLGMVKVFAMELGKRGIRVNCVAPGIIETDMSTALRGREGVVTEWNAATPLGRVGTVEEVAGVVAFLVSEDAAFVSGETIVVSGGFTSHL